MKYLNCLFLFAFTMFMTLDVFAQTPNTGDNIIKLTAPWTLPTQREDNSVLTKEEIGGVTFEYRLMTAGSNAPWTTIVLPNTATSIDLDLPKGNYEARANVFDSNGLYSNWAGLTFKIVNKPKAPTMQKIIFKQ